MTELIFAAKFILTAVILGRLLYKMLENRSEKNIVLFVLLFFMLLIDLRAIIFQALPTEFFPQLTALIFLVYMVYLIYLGKGSFSPWVINFMDFKNYFESEVIDAFDESVALVNNRTFDVIASNHNYSKLIKSSSAFLSGEVLVMTVLKGDERLEYIDSTHKKQMIQIRLKNFGNRYTLIFVKDITRFTELETYLKNEQLFFSRLWDQAPNMILIRKLSGEVVYVNDAMATFLKRTPSSMLYRPYVNMYSFKSESIRHQEIDQMVLEKNSSEGTHFLKYTHIGGQTSFIELSETIIYYESEKHILTSAIDRTVDVRTDLLKKSHEQIQSSLKGLPNHKYVVVDFTTNDLLYKENLLGRMQETLTNYNEFYRALSAEDQAQLDMILLNGNTKEIEPLTLFGKYTCLVESVYREQHGYTIGMLIKYIDMGDSTYGVDQIGQLVLNYIKEGILIIDINGRIEYTNERMLRLLDYKKEALLGMSILDISKGLSMDLVHKNWSLCRQHDSLHFERVYLDRLKNEVPVDLIAILMNVEDSEKLVLLVRDISEKTIYRQRMIDSQTRYSQILESLQDGVFEISLPDKKVTFFHEFDSEKGLIGLELNFLQWLNNIHDHDRSIVYEAIDTITSDKKANERFEYRYFQKGMWRWLRSTCKYVETDQEAMIVVTNQDISEIKAITEKLEESRTILIESERISKMAHFKYEVSTNLLIVSETFRSIFGLSSVAEQVHIDDLIECILFSDQIYFNHKFNKFIWNDAPLDLLIRVKVEGEIRFIQVKGELYKDDVDTPVYAIGTILNMTEKVYSNQKNDESRMLLENVVEHMPVGLIVIKRNGRVDKINREAMMLLHIEDSFSGTYSDFLAEVDHKFRIVEGKDLSTLLVDSSVDENYSVLESKIEKSEKRLKLFIIQMHDEEGRFQGKILNIKPIDS